MGASPNVYIGPYLQSDDKKEVTKMKIKRMCPLHPKRDPRNDKFCSICGNLIENTDVPDVKSYGIDDIF